MEIRVENVCFGSSLNSLWLFLVEEFITQFPRLVSLLIFRTVVFAVASAFLKFG